MKRLIFLITVILLLMPVAHAEDYTINGEDYYNQKTREILSGKLDLNPVSIVNALITDVTSELGEMKSLLKSVLIISVASGILRILSDSFGGSDTAQAASFACTLSVIGASVKIFSASVGFGTDVIHSLCGFITKFEPIFIGLLASSGAVTQAAAFQPVLTASIYILSLTVDKCILPLTYFSAVLGIVNNIGAHTETGALNNLIKSLSKWILTGVLTLFSAVLTLYGISTSSLNTLASRGIKFAVGSFVPVVGGLLSDSVDTVLSGTRLLKNAVGTAGMITVIAASALPLVKIWIMLMLLRITAAFTEPISDKHVTGVLQAVAEAVQMIFSAVITSAVLFIISIGIILTATGVGI